MQLSRTEAVRAALAATNGKHGQKSVTASSEPLTTDTASGFHGVSVKALASNTATVFVGIGTVAEADGMELNPGEGVTIDIDKASSVEVITGTATQTVSYIQT